MTDLIRVLVTLPMHSWTQTLLQENPLLKSEHQPRQVLSDNESVSEDDTLVHITIQQPLVPTASHQSVVPNKRSTNLATSISLHLLDIRKCCLTMGRVLRKALRTCAQVNFPSNRMLSHEV